MVEKNLEKNGINTSEKSARLLWSIILPVLCAVFIKVFLCDLVITEGRSMLPVLKPGSVLVINKAAYGIRIPGKDCYLINWSSPKPGDLIVFLTPFGEQAVKRCYSLDKGGEVFVKGT